MRGAAVKVALGRFARSGIETRFGTDLDAGVRAAALHYTRRLRSARPPVTVPRFCRTEVQAAASSESLEIPLSPRIEGVLRAEARRCGAPIDRVLAHAVLVFLADMDVAAETRQATVSR
jgi:hypothetical protein